MFLKVGLILDHVYEVKGTAFKNIILVGNKSDESGRTVEEAEGLSFAKKHKLAFAELSGTEVILLISIFSHLKSFIGLAFRYFDVSQMYETLIRRCVLPPKSLWDMAGEFFQEFSSSIF